MGGDGTHYLAACEELLAALACAVAAELTLRAFPGLMSIQWQLRHPEPQSAPFIVHPDKELAYLYPVTPESDRYGFENTEPWPEQPSVVFLGRFITERGGSLPELVARARPRDPVLNLGNGVGRTGEAISIYQRYGSQLHPALVVAALFLAADFEYDAAFREWLRNPDQTESARFRNRFAAAQRGEQPYIDWQTAIKTHEFRRLFLEVSPVCSHHRTRQHVQQSVSRSVCLR